MKMVRNIAIVAFAASFMFANVGFHYSNNYQDMDSGTTTVATSWGVSYDLNSTTSVGWDQELGMMMFFAVPNTGATLRLGWSDAVAETTADTTDDGLAAETSIGLGYTWWSGGSGIKTSISTNYDYIMAPGAADGLEAEDTFLDSQPANSTNLSVVVGFGF